MAFDYKKEYKEFYMPNEQARNYRDSENVTISQSGEKAIPMRKTENTKTQIGLLYGIAFTIKMSYKGTHKIEGFFEYVRAAP